MKLQSPIYRFYEKRLWKQIKNGPKPHHIGVILDGNRRFALKKGLDAKEGHFFGAEKVEELLIWCLRFGIKIITLYVFSTENFNRTSAEVEKIMGLLVTKLQKINKDPLIVNNKVRVKIIGRRDDLSDNIIALINEIEEKTKDYDGHILNIALSYGGRAEIVDAVRKIATKVQEKEINITEIDEETINEHLYTEGIPDPDLIIRTSGEERLSGFLLW